MNQFDAQALMAKRKLQLQASIQHSDNPYHQQHIREFTEYVDASINSLAHELKQWVPAVVDERIAQTKVQMEVDQPSMKKVKSKINELFSSLGRLCK